MNLFSRRKSTLTAGAIAAVAACVIAAPSASAFYPGVNIISGQELTAKGFDDRPYSDNYLAMVNNYTYIGKLSARYTVANSPSSTGGTRQLQVVDSKNNVVVGLGTAKVSGKYSYGMKASNALDIPYSYFNKNYYLLVTEGTLNEKKVVEIPLVEGVGGTNNDHFIGYTHEIGFYLG